MQDNMGQCMGFWYLSHTSASREGSGESVHMHSLTRAFAACIHEVYVYMKAQTKIYTSSFAGYVSMGIRGFGAYTR